MKRYLNEALLYAVLSLVGGVFYREFTKIAYAALQNQLDRRN